MHISAWGNFDGNELGWKNYRDGIAVGRSPNPLPANHLKNSRKSAHPKLTPSLSRVVR